MKRKIIITTSILCILLFSSMNVSSLNIYNAKDTTSNNSSKIEPLSFGNNYALTIYGYGGDGILLEHTKQAGEMVDGYFSSRGDYTTQILGRPFLLQVQNTIVNDIPNQLGNNKQIFIMITCHGSLGGGLYMQRLITITPSLLARWISDMEENLEARGKKYSCLTIFIHSCYAGVSQNYLSDSTKNRIIITSTDSNNPSYYDGDTGEIFFIEEFFNSLRSGKTYGKAWEDADALIDNGIYPSDQNPQISDNFGIVGTSQPDKLFPKFRLSLRSSPSGIIKAKNKAKNLKTILFENFEKFLESDSQLINKIRNVVGLI